MYVRLYPIKILLLSGLFIALPGWAYLPPAWYVVREFQQAALLVHAFQLKGRVEVQTGEGPSRRTDPGQFVFRAQKNGSLNYQLKTGSGWRGFVTTGDKSRVDGTDKPGSASLEAYSIFWFTAEKPALVIDYAKDLGINTGKVGFARDGKIVVYRIGLENGPFLFVDKEKLRLHKIVSSPYTLDFVYGQRKQDQPDFPERMIVSDTKDKTTFYFEEYLSLKGFAPSVFDVIHFTLSL